MFGGKLDTQAILKCRNKGGGSSAQYFLNTVYRYQGVKLADVPSYLSFCTI